MNILINAIDTLEETLGTSASRLAINGEDAGHTQGKRDETTTAPNLQNPVPSIRLCTRALGHDRVAIHIVDNGPGISESAQVESSRRSLAPARL